MLRGQGVYCWLEFKICRMFNSLKENIHSFPCRKSLTNCCPNHGVERHIWSATAVCNRSSFTFENTLFHRFLNKSSGNLPIFIKSWCFKRWRGMCVWKWWLHSFALQADRTDRGTLDVQFKRLTCKRRCRWCFYICGCKCMCINKYNQTMCMCFST